MLAAILVLSIAALIASGSNNVDHAHPAFEALLEAGNDMCASDLHHNANPALCLVGVLAPSVSCYLPLPPFATYAHDCFTQALTSLNKTNYPDLSKPLYTQEDVVKWVRKAGNEIDNYDYTNVKTHYDKVAHFFSQHGKREFNKSFNHPFAINNIMHWKAHKAVVIDAPPEMTTEGEINGIATWELGFPVTEHFVYDSIPEGQTAPKDETQQFLFIKVVRVPKSENPDGLGIDTWMEMTLEDWDKDREWLKNQKSSDAP